MRDADGDWEFHIHQYLHPLPKPPSTISNVDGPITKMEFVQMSLEALDFTCLYISQ
jgi:hypothetical protein